jgi:hypothetical protein
MGKIKDLTGHKYGKLTVVAPNKVENGYMTWKCKCDCGGEIIASSLRLKTGGIKSCGCLRTKSAQRAGKGRLINLTGQQFQFLTVLGDSGKRDNNKAILWECRCVCGNTTLVRGKDLKPGRIISCGCQQPKIQSKVGHKYKDAILKTMVEGTNIAVLNDRPTKRSKSGIKGVFWNKQRGKWEARIGFQGKVYKLGVFEFIEDAAKARKEAEEKLFNPILEKYGKDPI